VAYLEVDKNVGVFGHRELLVESDVCEREEAYACTEPQQEQKHNKSAHPGESQEVRCVKFFENIAEKVSMSPGASSLL
jgi:hypothetical protein